MICRITALVAALFVGTVTLTAQEMSAPATERDATTLPGADAQAPSFPTEIEQVVVDVVVTDKKGTPVRGLSVGDFEVLEDEVRQGIVSFEAIEVPREAPPAEPTAPASIRVSRNTVTRNRTGRTFVIVFDDMNMVPWRANAAKAAVASFLREAVREGDRVTLVSSSGGTWWSTRMTSGRDKLIDLVKGLEGRHVPEASMDRITDWEAYRIHILRDPQTYARVLRRFQTYNASFLRSVQAQRDVLVMEETEDPYIIQRASETYYQASARLRSTLSTLERVLNGLVGVRGRKSVILVSEGFIYDPNRDWFRQVNEASLRANAAIYFVNSKGLEGLPATMTAEFGGVLDSADVGMAIVDAVDAVAGAEDAATSSGGFVVRNTNDLSSGIQRIASENSAYYLLGYVPTNTTRDGEFREIEVKLPGHRDLRVRARKGYYGPSDTGGDELEAPEGVDPVIQAALDSPWDEAAIPLRMTHYVGGELSAGKAVVLVATEVDIRDLEFEEENGRFTDTLELLLVVAHRESGEFFRYDQSVVMSVRPETRERLERLWYPIVRDFELREGDYQAKIVVRAVNSGKVGTVVHEFEVPPLETLRVSTPVLSDAVATEETVPAVPGAPGARLEVMVRRVFPVGADLFCQIDVFGAKKDPQSGMPRVYQGYEVRRSDGTYFTSAAPSEIRPTSLGDLSRVSGFSLRGAAPGDYVIKMTVWDQLAGETLEMEEPFEVVLPLEENRAVRASAP